MSHAFAAAAAVVLTGAVVGYGCFKAGLLRNNPGVEVVVAHYNEDLAWVSKYNIPGVKFSIYSKGEPAAPEAVGILPNVGRESHTYLHHIVHNYDKLEPWTVFTQGAEPTWGYRNGDSRSGHLTDNVTFADYLRAFPEGRDSFFALSGACHIPRGIQATRLGIMVEGLKAAGTGLCPPAGTGGWSLWWFDPNHPHHKAGQAMLDFYHRHVLNDENDYKPVTLGFAQGARFAVSRARIHRRPRAYYVNLLHQMSKELDRMQGYYMETMWYDVFHPEAAQSRSPACAYPEVPASFGVNLKEMYESTARMLGESGGAALDAEALLGAYAPEASTTGTTTRTASSSTAPAPAPAPEPGSTQSAQVQFAFDMAGLTPAVAASMRDSPQVASHLTSAFSQRSQIPEDDVDVALSVVNGSRRLGGFLGGEGHARQLADNATAALHAVFTITLSLDSTVTNITLAMVEGMVSDTTTMNEVLAAFKALIQADPAIDSSIKSAAAASTIQGLAYLGYVLLTSTTTTTTGLVLRSDNWARPKVTLGASAYAVMVAALVTKLSS